MFGDKFHASENGCQDGWLAPIIPWSLVLSTEIYRIAGEHCRWKLGQAPCYQLASVNTAGPVSIQNGGRALIAT